MLLLVNLPLVLAIVVGSYVWYRAGFWTPSILRFSAHVAPRIVIVLGWMLVIGIAVKSVGGLFGDGRVQVRQSGRQYAHRTREPVLFWGEIAGELLLVGGTGTVLMVLGRRRVRELRGESD
jgi:hypothetical protein